MSYHNMLFLLVGMLSVGGFMRPADAVPTVKKLGMPGNYVQNTGATLSKTATKAAPVSAQRPASVRLGVGSIKPVTVNKATNTVKNDTSTDAQRLSVGKYIHASGVDSGHIKPIGSSSSTVVESSDFIDLSDRVVELEKQMKEKQDTLSAGTGIEIEDNEIGLSDELLQQLDEKVDVANLSSSYYNIQQTERYVQQIVNKLTDNNTVYNAETGERTYVSFVDKFNPSFLHGGGGEEETGEEP